MKVLYAVLLALVLIAGGAKVLSGQNGNATAAPIFRSPEGTNQALPAGVITTNLIGYSFDDGEWIDVSGGRFDHLLTDHGHDQGHHGHHQQAPPLAEMLPPIGPIGSVVAIGALVQYSLKRKINRVFEAPPATSIQIDHDRHHHDHDGHDHDHDGHDHDHDGHDHESEGHGDSNETAP